ncbi:MAG: AmmeMemoRadiSam system protein B [Candidatus Caldatribacteriaceae bacterium]
MVRKEAVAGYFYPKDGEELRTFVERLTSSSHGPLRRLEKPEGVKDTSGVISPHAGYMYSGAVACWSHYLLSLFPPFETIVVLGPNHRGVGKRVALSGAEYWRTPLGLVPVDLEAVEFLVACSPLFAVDDLAHLAEHSIEVQIPLLQYFLPYDFRILPVLLLSQDRKTALALGEAFFELSRKKRIALVASSDFSHYEPEEAARSKDMRAIEHILSLDVDGFYNVIQEENISICGPGAIASLLEYHARRSTQRGELLTYTHSGEVTGDRAQVVGYAALFFPLS